MQPRWGFDKIFSFEPAVPCWNALEDLARGDERVTILRYGLWSHDDQLVLHDPGMIGASLIADKRLTDTSAVVEVRDASEWFARHLAVGDEIVMKLNCEGSECQILDQLLASGQLAKVDELLVHFDVRKIPSQRHREAETRRRLDQAGVEYRPAESLFFGRNTPEKTENWLGWYHAGGLARLRYSVVRRIEFGLRTRVYKLRKRAG